MKNHLSYGIGLLVIFGCYSSTNSDKKRAVPEIGEPPTLGNIELTLEQANILATLPLECVEKEYPNKLGHVLGSGEDLGEPKALHPAFYGCFDWHSAVHGHWSMVKLLKLYPQLNEANRIRQILKTNLSKENIEREVAYFDGKHNENYERTYGWGWLLKLAEEIHTWDDPLAKEMEENLKPLSDLIAQKLAAYLTKLQYPVRVGTHTNTAFGLSFAWDYAQNFKDDTLLNAIKRSAVHFFLEDTGCPLNWEPSGADFLSPCFEEIDLMRRILNEQEFMDWMQQFMPQLASSDFNLEVALVGDREDGQPLAQKHVAYSFPNLVGDSYEGGHWLGSFAIYALSAQ